MKKLLLSLGTVAAVIAPVASVIACGSVTPTSKQQKKQTPTETPRSQIKPTTSGTQTATETSGSQTQTPAGDAIISLKDSELNSNEAFKALGAKDGTYTNTIKVAKDPKDSTGAITLIFTATKAGNLDGVDIEDNSKVTIIEKPYGGTINGIEITSDEDKVSLFLAILMDPRQEEKSIRPPKGEFCGYGAFSVSEVVKEMKKQTNYYCANGDGDFQAIPSGQEEKFMELFLGHPDDTQDEKIKPETKILVKIDNYDLMTDDTKSASQLWMGLNGEASKRFMDSDQAPKKEFAYLIGIYKDHFFIGGVTLKGSDDPAQTDSMTMEQRPEFTKILDGIINGNAPTLDFSNVKEFK